MLFERRELPEIHFLKHRHDDNDEFLRYEDKILDNSLSPYIYKNDLMNNWLKRGQSQDKDGSDEKRLKTNLNQ